MTAEEQLLCDLACSGKLLLYLCCRHLDEIEGNFYHRVESSMFPHFQANSRSYPMALASRKKESIDHLSEYTGSIRVLNDHALHYLRFKCGVEIDPISPTLILESDSFVLSFVS